MSKKKRPPKQLSPFGEEGYGPCIFTADLDGAMYEEFFRYRRWPPSEEQPSEPPEQIDVQVVPQRQADLDRTIGRLVRATAPSREEKKKAAQEEADIIAGIGREFDRREFEGLDDWIYRKSFKDNLREALIDFLNQPVGSHIFQKRVLVPSAYQLSGQQIGGSFTVDPKGNLDRLLLEALVWKARRALGLLWTLAEQNVNGALLRIAETVVPFAKAMNEKASANPEVLGNWPKKVPLWPVVKSLHRDFDTDHRSFLKELQVGSDYPFTIGEGVRWTARDPIGRWAIHLAQSIEIMIVSDYTLEELSDMWNCRLEALGSFSGQTWKNWWTASKALLVNDYLDVVKIPELNATVKSAADRKSPGRIRKRIYQALKDKFKSMALQNKVK